MKRSTVVKALIAVALSATAAQAQDKLNIVGTVNLYQLVAGPGGNLVIDFVPPAGGGVGAVYTPQGFTGNTGAFAAVPASTPGTNVDFVFGPGMVPPPTTTPVNFLTIGGYTFTATQFGTGNTGTPVNLFENFGTVFATLSVQGFVNGAGLAPNTPFVGGYSAQIPGTIANVISRIENNAAGIGNVSVSATFTTVSAVPEPATFVLMGSGLLALAGVAARRRRA
jgi:hypothetical protein